MRRGTRDADSGVPRAVGAALHWEYGNMSTPGTLVGSCACGAIRFIFAPPVRWCTHCHCHSCRRHHGAAIVTWLGGSADSFKLSGREHLKWYVSSEDSKRGFCSNCGSPLLFLSTRWPDEVHVTRASLHGEVDITPGGHIFFDQHVSWFLFEDSLPRMGGKGWGEPAGELAGPEGGQETP